MTPRVAQWSAWCTVLLALALAGCGFRFRGEERLPFESVYVTVGDYTSFSAELKRFLAGGSKTRVVENPAEAQVLLEILSERENKQILSLSAGGKVREYELLYVIRFRLSGQDKRDWIAPTDMTLRRDYTFDDQAQLAKENEEVNLLRDMRKDALSMLLRRLAKARPPEAT